jgi:hypothetical protein
MRPLDRPSHLLEHVLFPLCVFFFRLSWQHLAHGEQSPAAAATPATVLRPTAPQSATSNADQRAAEHMDSVLHQATKRRMETRFAGARRQNCNWADEHLCFLLVHECALTFLALLLLLLLLQFIRFCQPSRAASLRRRPHPFDQQLHVSGAQRAASPRNFCTIQPRQAC